ncbi:SRPBCC family protein [Xanthobacter sp. KR7-65]|uniref:aromatic ring-hydroxylating oxygenase subunit alpha n=1 Tax=Xanthobacter sp. KR7-65 TaxID=3156612 RepID=UPI0032B35B38
MTNLSPLRTVSPGAADWAKAACDPDAFAREQAAHGQLWTFLGLASEVAEDGAWFRTELGGRSVFVQRFGDVLRGFENICAHRFHPLRQQARGKGPIVCAFHHWRYNKDGLALGVPVCDEAYGCSPKALDARLRPVEVDTCGGLVFGRLPGRAAGESLAEFLGDAGPILAALCPPGVTGRRIGGEIAANWKFLTHVSLDDYHLVAVHPSSFGRFGYLKKADVTYARMGRHSLYTTEKGDDPAARILAACRAGTYTAGDYLIVNLFPSLGVSQFYAVRLFGRTYFGIQIFRYVPLAHDRARLDAWLAPAPMAPRRTGFWGVVDRVAEAVVYRVVPYYARQVAAEDQAVCAAQQTVAKQIDGQQRISPAFEGRIGWFEEVYAAETRAAETRAAEPLAAETALADRPVADQPPT